MEEKWSAKLASKGKGIGVLNDDGSIYVIGSEVAMGTPGTPGFTESRKNAYGNAELTANVKDGVKIKVIDKEEYLEI